MSGGLRVSFLRERALATTHCCRFWISLCGLLGVLAIPQPATAQGTTTDSGVDVTASFVTSFQSVDTYYQGPYLENHLGGVGFGGAVATAWSKNRFVLDGEVSSAIISKDLSGRLVGDDAVEVRFQETLVSAQAGYSTRNRRFRAFGGVALRFGLPEVEGTKVSWTDVRLVVPTGGIDFSQPIASSASLAFGVRYFFVDRTPEQRSLGLGKHLLRFGVGISFGTKH